MRDQFERGLRRIIQAGIDGGEFRDVDVKIAGFAILGAINWTSKWYDPKGPRSQLEIAQTFAAMLVGGLRV